MYIMSREPAVTRDIQVKQALEGDATSSRSGVSGFYTRVAQTNDCATESKASNCGAFGVAKLYCVGKRFGDRFPQDRGKAQVRQIMLPALRQIILQVTVKRRVALE